MAKTVHGPKPTSTQLVSGEMRVGTSTWPTPWATAGSGLPPQYQRLPSDCIATVSSVPAHTLIQLVAEPTCRGTALLLVEPVPSVPDQLLPQAHSVPSCFRATLCMPPATACFQSCPGAAGTGTLASWFCLPAVPTPNWPVRFCPQAQSVPSALMARL